MSGKSDGGEDLFKRSRNMYDPLGNPIGGARPPSNTPQTPFGNPFYGASSGLIRGGLGAYGEKILGSSSEYVQNTPLNSLMGDLQLKSRYRITTRLQIGTPRSPSNPANN
ncbi:hypothetical protein E3N88_36459 [Mikania micrantha]|uniref:Uncharacterized protein n=1 Tax=Mikania micrantha TaxID=192012 RepID=A0A5N6M3U4_9ASTR|nr:hypothetical protein E3N88_36459 [Mikania micrantha]